MSRRLLGRPRRQTLTILAGSELKDLEPLFPDIQRATGVLLQPTYIGTLEGAEKIAGGDTSDAAWFSHAQVPVAAARRRPEDRGDRRRSCSAPSSWA